VWALASVWALCKTAGRARDTEEGLRAAPDGGYPAVSVLKPLCGVDDALEQNLRSFFLQDYPGPRFELVFGVEGADDPVVAVVHRLRVQFPQVRCRLVVHDGGRGINPKVANLREMMEAARHDVVVISDSNVRVPPCYLATMCAELLQPGVELVTSLFVGRQERSLGATLEVSQLNGPTITGLAGVNQLLGHPACMGKSMAFRRSVLRGLGGLESVAAVLAEDYVIGRMFSSAGHGVKLSSLVVDNICRRTGVAQFFKRQLRWNMIRIRMVPLPFLLEPLTVPFLVALAAPLFSVSLAWGIVWAAAVTVARDGLSWWRLRGGRGLVPALLVSPLRDLLMGLAHLATPFCRHVSWRGRRVRVSAGTRLYAEPGGYAAPSEGSE